MDKHSLEPNDYRLFQNTSVWELAKAVEDEDIEGINNIIKQNHINIDTQDSIYGKTLLMLAIANYQYKSCEALLKLGANPNSHDTYDGTSPIIESAKAVKSDILLQFNAIPKNFDNTQYLRLLLKYGGNPSDIEVGPRRGRNTARDTPLIASIGLKEWGSSLPKVKLLVEAGADINYMNEFKTTVLNQALMTDDYDVVIYLIQKGADYTMVMSEVEGKKYYIIDELRFDMHELNSKEHKDKMALVALLKQKGLDYYKIPIPEYVQEEAKKIYPNNWKEYLEKY